VINAFATWQLLLATRDDSGVFWGRFDHQRAGFGATEWALIIGATFLLVVVASISYWRAKRQKAEFLSHNPSRLLAELCRAHRLSRSERWLMRRLASAQGLENGCAIFVEPEYFDSGKRPPMLEPLASELRQLRHKLFE
jgi:hypothetical protein